MLSNKGMTLISIVIMIIIMIILAALVAPQLSSVIDDSYEADAKVELKNVQTVIETAKAKILIDEFSPNSVYVISDSDLERKFGEVLTDDEIQHIEDINDSDSYQSPYKYYLMTKENFNQEFGTEINVSGLRDGREYLVNYMDGVVIVSNNGERISNKGKDAIIPAIPVVRGDVKVRFYPNGNEEWARQQAALVTFDLGTGTHVNYAKYMWSEEVNEPGIGDYLNAPLFNGVSNGFSQTVTLDTETGNGWFIWVLVEYDDAGVTRTKQFRSEAFYIDNTPPSAVLEVNEITR